MSNSKAAKLLFAVAITLSICVPASIAGPNDYFSGGPINPGSAGSEKDDTPKGSMFSSSSPTAQSAPAPASGPNPGSGVGYDNTGDEKRMQRKYKANLNHMKELISKGDTMMKTAANKEDKQYKKGKILKETGEKHLAEMQANSPYAQETLFESDAKRQKAKEREKPDQ